VYRLELKVVDAEQSTGVPGSKGDTGLARVALDATLADFRLAAVRIERYAIVSPLLPLSCDDRVLRLKAETLQPSGSFKIRCAANVLASLPPERLARGVVTASAGNFGLGLAFAGRIRGTCVTVHAPETAARTKVQGLRALGATVMEHPFSEWWRIMSTRRVDGSDEPLIHPVCEAPVSVGNGTIGLEIAQQWPEAEIVLVPYGGGGLSVGIALALKAAGRATRVIACEVESSTPFASARQSGQPVAVDRGPSWIDGIGSQSVLSDMWPLVSRLIDDVVVVRQREAEDALRRLARESHLIVEGAAAVAVAAALRPQFRDRRLVALVSGGNIDMPTFTHILQDAESARGTLTQ
jgi:threonine dehydratase